MEPTLVSARLRYLNDSAHLLVVSAPRTSAFLMASCNSLLFDNDLEQSNSQRRQACRACGNISLLSATATRKLEQGKDIKRRRSGDFEAPEHHTPVPKRDALYDCELCGRQTRETVSFSTSRALHSRTSHSNGIISDPVTRSRSSCAPFKASSGISSPTDASNTISANASSKKRARFRKQGELQALLANKKDPGSRSITSGFGLDLMDLMRKA